MEIEDFDIKDIKSDSSILIIGHINTGKTILVNDILYQHRDIPLGSVATVGERNRDFYLNRMPELLVHDDNYEKLCKSTLVRQKRIISKIKENKIKADPRLFFVLENCFYDSQFSKNKYLKPFFQNNKSFHILFILTMNYAIGVKPALRENLDFIIIFDERLERNRKQLYIQHFGEKLCSYDEFIKIMKKLEGRGEYKCLIKNQMSNKLYFYKAKLHPDLKLCHKQIWDYCEKMA